MNVNTRNRDLRLETWVLREEGVDDLRLDTEVKPEERRLETGHLESNQKVESRDETLRMNNEIGTNGETLGIYT